jgi:uncharacterized membrane protein (UPF0127 family)
MRVLLLATIGCAAPVAPHDPRPTVTFAPDAVVHVELVATAAEVEHGLMGRTRLPPDDGMLFLFDHDQDWIFWMVDTHIPLDLIFITHELAVAGIVANAVPMTDTLLRIDAKSRYVVEVNAGWSAVHHVVTGAKVTFSGVVR